jgi:hypothetical protein
MSGGCTGLFEAKKLGLPERKLEAKKLVKN